MSFRHPRRTALLAFAVMAALFLAPASASAHAYVVHTSPSAGSVVKTEPKRVTVVWDEAITLGSDGARAALGVYAGDGKRVDTGDVQHPLGDTLTVALKPNLPHGTYTVGWKVTSADTHVVSGAFTFSVGAPGAGGGIAGKLLAAERVPLELSDGFAVVRFFNLLLVLLCAGGAVSLVFVMRDAAPQVRRRLWGLLVGCAIGLVFVALLGLPFEAAEQNGTSLWSGFSASAIASVRHVRFGQVWLARTWLAIIIAALSVGLQQNWTRGRRIGEGLLLAAALALALTPSASGHANVEGALTFIVDALHVVSASIWGGGLTFLAAALLFSASGPLATRGAGRSPLLHIRDGVGRRVAGSGRRQRLSGGPGDSNFFDSTYGWLVVVKIALAFPLLALGAFNNRVSIPKLQADIDSTDTRRGFVRAIGAELLVFVAIIGVTAVLIDEAPAKNTVQAAAGPLSTQTTVGPFGATLKVTPATAGSNTITVKLTNRAGRPANIAQVSVNASLPSRSLGPLGCTTKRTSEGTFVAVGAVLQIAGTWQIQLVVRQGQFNEWLRTVPVAIGN